MKSRGENVPLGASPLFEEASGGSRAEHRLISLGATPDLPPLPPPSASLPSLPDLLVDEDWSAPSPSSPGAGTPLVSVPPGPGGWTPPSALPSSPGVPFAFSATPGPMSPLGLPAVAPELPLFGVDETDVNAKAFLALYDQKRFGEIARAFLKVLAFYDRHSYEEIGYQFQERIDRFVEVFLYIMTKPDFGILNELAPSLVSHNHIITNLVAMSSFKTTDPQIRILMNQAGNLVKLLMLYSAQNTVRLDVDRLFKADPHLASLWYTLSPVGQAGSVTETAWANLRDHVRAMHEKFEVLDDRVSPIYFLSTYWDPDNDHLIKGELNRKIRRRLDGVHITNRPDPRRVAILTEKWFPGSAVYKSSHPFLAELAKRRRLTLVHFGPKKSDLDYSLFDDVRQVTVRHGKMDIREIMENDFQMAYFPDVGMNPESIWLSNLRVAPIQVAGYGHPVSTFGSLIDYFLGGADVEIAADARRNYSERLVLIPGIGAHPVYPDYTPRRPPRTNDLIWINCSWGYAKFNHPMVRNLQEIRRRASRPVRFQLFPAWSLGDYNAMWPFRCQMRDALGDAGLVVGNQTYETYMQLMERAHLSIDSYPFGGYNTIVDSLHLGLPIVAYEGSRFQNRAASALLRRIGLEELIARNDEEYVAKTVRLLDDDEYREELSRRLASIDLRQRVYDTAEPKAFVRAIDFLIENHDALAQDDSRSPVFIQ